MSDLPYRPCVGVCLINAQGLIFAGLRRDSAAQAWQMPQGGIDDGEKPRAAALRELWEETGVTADLVEFIAKTDDWVTYDLPPDLLGKVWGGTLPCPVASTTARRPSRRKHPPTPPHPPSGGANRPSPAICQSPPARGQI